MGGCSGALKSDGLQADKDRSDVFRLLGVVINTELFHLTGVAYIHVPLMRAITRAVRKKAGPRALAGPDGGMEPRRAVQSPFEKK